MTIKELAFILLTREIKERVDTVDLKAINELTCAATAIWE
jgi:hypothetical protein